MKKSMALKFAPGSSIIFGSLRFTAGHDGDLKLLEHEHPVTTDQAGHLLPTTPAQGLHVTDGKPGHAVACLAEYESDSAGSPRSDANSDPIYNAAALSESDSEWSRVVYMVDGADGSQPTTEQIAADAERERQRAEQLAKQLDEEKPLPPTLMRTTMRSAATPETDADVTYVRMRWIGSGRKAGLCSRILIRSSTTANKCFARRLRTPWSLRISSESSRRCSQPMIKRL